MPIYKVSYVIPEEPHASLILTQEHPPRADEAVMLHGRAYRITEVIELLPPQGLIRFFHATVTPADNPPVH